MDYAVGGCRVGVVVVVVVAVVGCGRLEHQVRRRVCGEAMPGAALLRGRGGQRPLQVLHRVL